ncbi:MAG: hypothetical protein IKH75_11540 [Ruminococcus sp.]|nr:hypothetical protein [Ruminococcus sp.]
MPSAKLFDEYIATAYGIPEAVMLNDIMYWEKHNRLNGRNYFNGRYWTYNTFKAFTETYPYFSERTIKRAIQHLIDADLILVGNFDNDRFRHTNYYTLSDKAMEYFSERPNRECQNGTIGSAKMTPSYNNISNIDSNNTGTNNTNITLSESLVSDETKRKKELFEQFWKAYPKCKRKVDKPGCEIAFLKIKNLEQIFPDIMASLELWKREWSKQNYEYVPMTKKWIKQEYWQVLDMRSEREAAADQILANNMQDYM